MLKKNYKKINNCRCCGSKNLIPIISLGSQVLTGVFPKSKNLNLTKGPLSLVRCNSKDGCKLVQLQHSYNLNELYGKNYGYRSGLNKSMVNHLHENINLVLSKYFKQNKKKNKLVVLDIGSNDATTLKAYPKKFKLIGYDPTAKKFAKYYPKYIDYVSSFFSYKSFKRKFSNIKADIITSFSMFYDLEDPLKFMNEINQSLSDDGIWVFEQSYLPFMIKTVSFDTICHEHLEYYTLYQVNYMAKKTNLKILDVIFNDVNGGSFLVFASKNNSKFKINSRKINRIINKEKKDGIISGSIWKKFTSDVLNFKKDVTKFFDKIDKKNLTVMGLGASTKGNVLLQYLKIKEKNIKAIGEVNSDKFGSYTPGTKIKIIDEKKVFSSNPDYIFILPWHFKKFFLNLKILKKFNLIFPLPKFTLIKKKI